MGIFKRNNRLQFLTNGDPVYGYMVWLFRSHYRGSLQAVHSYLVQRTGITPRTIKPARPATLKFLLDSSKGGDSCNKH